ncbi:MAG: hypothetical protein JWR16_2528 [Nevskia sp.]|nr:hypothetical protein [Nevskia sp.]
MPAAMARIAGKAGAQITQTKKDPGLAPRVLFTAQLKNTDYGATGVTSLPSVHSSWMCIASPTLAVSRPGVSEICAVS